MSGTSPERLRRTQTGSEDENSIFDHFSGSGGSSTGGGRLAWSRLGVSISRKRKGWIGDCSGRLLLRLPRDRGSLQVPADRPDELNGGRRPSLPEDFDEHRLAPPGSTSQSRASSANPQVVNLLLDQHGFVERGEVLFIYGGSGSGKSTLLRALCGRGRGRVTGNVTFNGIPIAQLQFGKRAKLLDQTPTLLSDLTVRESLDFADKFSRGGRGHEAYLKRRARVARMLKVLGLLEYADCLTGSVGFTPDLQVRLGMGIELMAGPQVLLIDDPTGAFDSYTASVVMKFIVQIARRTATTILCAIHSSSPQIFALSSKTLVLGGGRMVFFGPTPSIYSYFAELDAPEARIPNGVFIAEHVQAVSDSSFGDPEISRLLVAAWNESAEKRNLVSELTVLDVDDIELESKRASASHVWRDCSILLSRLFSARRRTPRGDGLRVVSFLIFALLIGAINVQRISDETDDFNKVSRILVIVSLAPLPSAYLLFQADHERRVLRREIPNQHYSVTSYWLAKMLWGVILTAIVSLSAGPILYFMAGLNSEGARFWIYEGIYWLTLLVLESILHVVATVTSSPSVGFMCFVVVFTFGLLTQGFILFRRQQSPLYRWMTYISFSYYSYSAMAVNHYRGMSGLTDPSIPVGDLTGQVFLERLNIGSVVVWQNVLALLALWIVHSLGFWVALQVRYRTGKW